MTEVILKNHTSLLRLKKNLADFIDHYYEHKGGTGCYKHKLMHTDLDSVFQALDDAEIVGKWVVQE